MTTSQRRPGIKQITATDGYHQIEKFLLDFLEKERDDDLMSKFTL